ncbi:MAG TPA: FliM/FliN family flagellar motor switch protein [Solirubrobacteraceae bacterium]|nr:FliM/FliN family flagellar motor switch protein [Solirubrobacteraceae bacterium]
MTSTVQPVDFSQPTKFSAELRRRIVRAIGPVCEAIAIRLTSELRAPVELAIADSQQLSWAAAKAQLPVNALAAGLEVTDAERSDGRQMLLSIDSPFILRALECLLGGSASMAPSERRLSEIDWALTQRLLEGVTAQLGAAWRDLGLDLGLAEIDVEGDGGVVAPHGEPTFAVTFDAAIESLHSGMTLLIPWSTISPVAEEIVGMAQRREEADPQQGHAVRRGMARAPVLLRAEIGAVQMPVERALALAPGTLLLLDRRAEEGMTLFAERVPLARVSPGLRGQRRAIRLATSIEPGGVLAVRSGNDVTQPHAGDRRDHGLGRMTSVPVRVWAELGRTTLALASALELPAGTVLELEQDAAAPIEVFVGGKRFAHGALQVTAEGIWAVQLDALL